MPQTVEGDPLPDLALGQQLVAQLEKMTT